MIDIGEDTVLKISEKTRWRKYLKSVVVEPGIALNETAAAVFEKCDGARTVGQICREVTNEFDVEYGVCLADTVGLAREMLDQGMLEPV